MRLHPYLYGAFRAAMDALRNDDLTSYHKHSQKMVADLKQADRLQHGSVP